jgi:selenocysteine lyase/cysteine desulfurase
MFRNKQLKYDKFKEEISRDWIKGYPGMFTALSRIGLSTVLNWVITPLVFLAFIDLLRFSVSYHFSLRLDMLGEIFNSHSHNFILPAVYLLFFFSLLPLVLGASKVLLGFNLDKRPSYFSRNHNLRLFGFALFFISSITIIYIFTKCMEINSGYIYHKVEYNNQTNKPGKISPDTESFNDSNKTIEKFLSPLIKLTGRETIERSQPFEFTSYYANSIEWTIFSPLGKYLELLFLLIPFIAGKNKEFLTQTWLSDLDSNCYPVHQAKLLNFNTADTAPVIKYVKKRRDKLVDFFDATPEASELNIFLMSCWEDCKKLIFQLIDQPYDLKNKQVGLFNDAGRALETTLGSFSGDKNIILSPYEIPKVKKLCEWYKTQNPCEVKTIHSESGFFETPLNEQVEIVAEEIFTQLHYSKTNIVILSEVCYSTGLAIELEKIIRTVETHCAKARPSSKSPPKYIIMGSYAVENLKTPKGLELGDAYVFSCDKWLMAPEPGGIAIIKNNKNSLKPYDCLDTQIPLTTFDPTKIAGIRASLELLTKFDYLDGDFFTKRSTGSKNLFLRRLEDSLVVIGRETGLKSTKMVSVKPNYKYKWKYNTIKSLESYFEANSILVKVIKLEDNLLVVRVSFSFFHVSGDIKKLTNALNGAIEPPYL